MIMISLIVFPVMSAPFSEWNVVVCFALFKPPPVCLDKFQAVGDQLESASLDSFLCFPSVLVQGSNDSYSGSFVEIFGGNFG
jgi:hypothetical protein